MRRLVSVSLPVLPCSRPFRPALGLVAGGCVALLLFGCDNTARVNFQSGELTFAVSSADIGLPPELQAMDGRIATIPCGGATQCPPSTLTPLSCDGSGCDPEPIELVAPVGEPIDVDALRSGLPTAVSRVEAIDIREITYAINLNTFTLPMNDVQVLWAPEGAATGMTLLGTIPSIEAEAVETGLVLLDGDGELELSDYLLGTSPRVRFFIRTTIDLNPGDPFPEGELQVGVTVALTASGPIID